jgi:hypothetical protein
VTDSDPPQRFWLHTALLQAPDGTLSPAFVIDERAYPDQAAARADLNEAFGALQRAGVPAQFEAVSVRAGMAGGRVEPPGGTHSAEQVAEWRDQIVAAATAAGLGVDKIWTR